MRATDLKSPSEFGEIVPGPTEYLHYTNTDDQVRSILQTGFNLKKFGNTAKQHRMPDMMAHDPVGVFALDAAEEGTPSHRPWVKFTLTGTPRCLSRPDQKYPGMSDNLKEELSSYYGVSGKKLTDILRRDGVDVLHSSSEYIILDPNMIKFTSSSQS